MQRGKFCQTMRVATSIFVGLRIHAPVQSLRRRSSWLVWAEG
jgi:hypothetical protein